MLVDPRLDLSPAARVAGGTKQKPAPIQFIGLAEQDLKSTERYCAKIRDESRRIEVKLAIEELGLKNNLVIGGSIV